MTEKQRRILEAALELFANHGFDATSTSKIAKAAGVSEGLIFRHFKNKEGLLEALNVEAKGRLEGVIAEVCMENDPDAVLRRAIDMPFEVPDGEHDFWRLQYKLKWQKKYDDHEKMQPLIDKLKWAFEQRGAREPFTAAAFLALVIDAMAMEILKGRAEQQQAIRKYLYDKYEL